MDIFLAVLGASLLPSSAINLTESLSETGAEVSLQHKAQHCQALRLLRHTEPPGTCKLQSSLSVPNLFPPVWSGQLHLFQHVPRTSLPPRNRWMITGQATVSPGSRPARETEQPSVSHLPDLHLPELHEPAVSSHTTSGNHRVPSVLQKLQKWGDYPSYGEPVQPTL